MIQDIYLTSPTQEALGADLAPLGLSSGGLPLSAGPRHALATFSHVSGVGALLRCLDDALATAVADAVFTNGTQIVERPEGAPQFAGDMPSEDGGFVRGMILMWSGAADAVPTGWALCDGEDGTPDLRDRFVIGAGSTYAVGATGGAATHSHTATTGAHTLTAAQMPSHCHGISMGYTSSDQGYVGGGTNSCWGTLYTGYSGGGGSHSHTATVNASSSLPPYYALAFIMKV